MQYKTKEEKRWRRHRRIRKKIVGLPERPRVCVFKSLRHIYAQAIDDVHAQTLVSASSLDPSIRGEKKNATIETAKKVGALLAQRLKEKGIETVVFDRAGYKYHGQVKALCEALRENGIKV